MCPEWSGGHQSRASGPPSNDHAPSPTTRRARMGHLTVETRALDSNYQVRGQSSQGRVHAAANCCLQFVRVPQTTLSLDLLEGLTELTASCGLCQGCRRESAQGTGTRIGLGVHVQRLCWPLHGVTRVASHSRRGSPELRGPGVLLGLHHTRPDGSALRPLLERGLHLPPDPDKDTTWLYFSHTPLSPLLH